MIIPMLCVTIFVILVVWFLLPRVARLMIHTPTAISIFVCLSMVQLMAVFISMRCTLCGHFLQVALTLILVVGYAISGAMAKAGKGLLEGTLQAGTSAVSDKLLDLVGLGGKSAADKGKDTRDYLAAAFPELNAWERAGAD